MPSLGAGTGVPRPMPLGHLYVLLIAAMVLWGASPVAGKVAVRQFPPITAGALRYGSAALMLFLLFHRTLPAWGEMGRGDRRILIAMGGLGIFLNHVLFYFGLVLAPASHASILSPTVSPVWTIFLASRFGGERITRERVVGMILCVAGVILVARPASPAPGVHGMGLVGNALLILSGIAWGSYSFFSKVAMRRLSAMTAFAYGMAVGSLLLVLLALFERPWNVLTGISVTCWVALLYVTVGSTLVATFWWNLAIQQVGASRTAVFGNLQPVFGVLLSWWILGEQLTAIQLIGGSLAVLGVWVCQGTATLQLAWQQAAERWGRLQRSKEK